MADDLLQAHRACTKCGVNKPLTNEHFAKQRRGMAGLAACCKTCMNATIRRLKADNPDKVAAQMEGYRARAVENARRHAARDPARAAKHKKEWLERNYEANLKRLRVFKQENREHVRKQERARYRKDLTHSRLLKRVNENKRRARKAGLPATLTAKQILEKLDLQCGHCWWCEMPLTKYHVDHVIPGFKRRSNHRREYRYLLSNMQRQKT